MLRKFRIIAALFCFLFITLLFLDFTGSIHVWFGWLAKIQFLPAVLALNVAVVLALIILTLIFGRIYCSVIWVYFKTSYPESAAVGKRKNTVSPIHRPYHG